MTKCKIQISFISDSMRHFRRFVAESVFLTIQLSQGKRMARKLLAKCQKQPWQQPCNLIVSHEETFRQFVSPSHEQTTSLKWPRLFSWKNKVGKSQNSFGQNTFNFFFFSFFVFSFLNVCLYTTVVPKRYKEIYTLKHHQWVKVRLTQLALLKSNTTHFNIFYHEYKYTRFKTSSKRRLMVFNLLQTGAFWTLCCSPTTW